MATEHSRAAREKLRNACRARMRSANSVLKAAGSAVRFGMNGRNRPQLLMNRSMYPIKPCVPRAATAHLDWPVLYYLVEYVRDATPVVIEDLMSACELSSIELPDEVYRLIEQSGMAA